jgi:hypothetical protein
VVEGAKPIAELERVEGRVAAGAGPDKWRLVEDRAGLARKVFRPSGAEAHYDHA